MITQSQITNNIDLVWEILNGHVEAIRVTKGVTVLWCVCYTVFPKDHSIDSAIDYIRIDEDLMDRCPIILASCACLSDEATSNDIHVHKRTAVYPMDNKIFL